MASTMYGTPMVSSVMPNPMGTPMMSTVMPNPMSTPVMSTVMPNPMGVSTVSTVSNTINQSQLSNQVDRRIDIMQVQTLPLNGGLISINQTSDYIEPTNTVTQTSFGLNGMSTTGTQLYNGVYSDNRILSNIQNRQTPDSDNISFDGNLNTLVNSFSSKNETTQPINSQQVDLNSTYTPPPVNTFSTSIRSTNMNLEIQTDMKELPVNYFGVSNTVSTRNNLTNNISTTLPTNTYYQK